LLHVIIFGPLLPRSVTLFWSFCPIHPTHAMDIHFTICDLDVHSADSIEMRFWQKLFSQVIAWLKAEGVSSTETPTSVPVSLVEKPPYLLSCMSTWEKRPWTSWPASRRMQRSFRATLPGHHHHHHPPKRPITGHPKPVLCLRNQSPQGRRMSRNSASSSVAGAPNRAWATSGPSRWSMT